MPITREDLQLLKGDLNMRALLRRTNLNHGTVGKVISGAYDRPLHPEEAEQLGEALGELRAEIAVALRGSESNLEKGS